MPLLVECMQSFMLFVMPVPFLLDSACFVRSGWCGVSDVGVLGWRYSLIEFSIRVEGPTSYVNDWRLEL